MVVNEEVESVLSNDWESIRGDEDDTAEEEEVEKKKEVDKEEEKVHEPEVVACCMRCKEMHIRMWEIERMLANIQHHIMSNNRITK